MEGTGAWGRAAPGRAERPGPARRGPSAAAGPIGGPGAEAAGRLPRAGGGGAGSHSRPGPPGPFEVAAAAHPGPRLIPADAGVLAPPHSSSVRAEWRWLITSLAPPRVNERIRHCARRMEKIRQPLSSHAKRGFDVGGASEAPFPATPSPGCADSPAGPPQRTQLPPGEPREQVPSLHVESGQADTLLSGAPTHPTAGFRTEPSPPADS